MAHVMGVGCSQLKRIESWKVRWTVADAVVGERDASRRIWIAAVKGGDGRSSVDNWLGTSPSIGSAGARGGGGRRRAGVGWTASDRRRRWVGGGVMGFNPSGFGIWAKMGGCPNLLWKMMAEQKGRCCRREGGQLAAVDRAVDGGWGAASCCSVGVMEDGAGGCDGRRSFGLGVAVGGRGRQRWTRASPAGMGRRWWSLGKMMMEHHTGAPCSGGAP
ncbi:hypothetical protein ACLOJK_015592 [Asimina triloba]